jgi:hypothetical protein
MPAVAVSAEGTTITSLQTQSSTCEVPGAGFVQGVYNLQVLRPEGNSNYLVLGDTGDQIDPCDSQLHSYPAGIPVKVGDTLGVYVVSSWVGDLSLFGGPIEYYSFPPEPAVGATVTVPNPEESVLDESATLVPLPTSNDQCKNGGWQNFGTTFKNQGDCVSFVATGGKNPPSGS